MTGVKAFREAFISAGLQDSEDFSDWEARQVRYEIFWAWYENTQYRHTLHNWSLRMRQDQALYKYIRGIYNPAYRLGEFWKQHIWGGQLDEQAGTTGAIPIKTENDALRKAIAECWKWSNWSINKNIATLRGSILGDIGLQVVDDTDKKRVYLQLVHPGTISELDLDERGNVKGYTIEETRKDPRQTRDAADVVYKEVVGRSGESVTYKTYLNNTLYPWNDVAAEWSEPYGFVPLVLIQHNNVGLDWAFSELQAGRPKFQEVDDLASKLSDQIRKLVDPVWFFSGMKRPVDTPTITGNTPSADKPAPGREEIPAIYASDPAATASPLIAAVDIAGTAGTIKDLLAELERDYPELQMDIWSAESAASGKALRIARERVSDKVTERRTNYDDALVRAQEMAVAIGGFRGYDGYTGFNLESYKQGNLEHSIAEREVFAKDPLDDLEVERVLWETAKLARDNGVPLAQFLARQGWKPEQIDEIINSDEFKAQEEMKRAPLSMAQNTLNRTRGQNNAGNKPPQ